MRAVWAAFLLTAIGAGLEALRKSGKKVETLSIDEAQLGNEVRPVLLKQAYVMFHANRRQGSARTKSRGMVEGSTRKLYRHMLNSFA